MCASVKEVNDLATDGTLSVAPRNPVLEAVVVKDMTIVALEHDDIFLLREFAYANRTRDVRSNESLR